MDTCVHAHVYPQLQNDDFKISFTEFVVVAKKEYAQVHKDSSMLRYLVIGRGHGVMTGRGGSCDASLPLGSNC